MVDRLGFTPFQDIYDRFLTKVTDDMYLEMSAEETAADLKNILISSLVYFKKPKFSIYDYDNSTENFNIKLTSEEIEIISELMLLTWIKRQIANVDIVKMKYSTDDFSLTSQANHLKTLMALQQQFEYNADKLQKLYMRRNLQEDGMYAPTIPVFGGANYEK